MGRTNDVPQHRPALAALSRRPVYPLGVQTEAELLALRATPARRRRAHVMVLGSALWIWLLAVALPMLELGIGGWAGALTSLGFPLVVALGLGLDRMAFPRDTPSTRRLTEAVLFGIAPLFLVAALAARTELVPREVLGTLHAALIAGASAAYLAAVAHLSTTHAHERRARPQPLPPSARIVEPRWPRALRGLLVGGTALAALALVAVAPLVTGHATRLARYGIDGAETAALLAAVLGLAAGIVALGAIVAPALRARSGADRLPSRLGPLGWIAVAIVATALWAWLERM